MQYDLSSTMLTGTIIQRRELNTDYGPGISITVEQVFPGRGNENRTVRQEIVAWGDQRDKIESLREGNHILATNLVMSSRKDQNEQWRNYFRVTHESALGLMGATAVRSTVGPDMEIPVPQQKARVPAAVAAPPPAMTAAPAVTMPRPTAMPMPRPVAVPRPVATTPAVAAPAAPAAPAIAQTASPATVDVASLVARVRGQRKASETTTSSDPF